MIALAAMGLLVAACGGGESDTVATDETTTTVAPTTTRSAEEVAAHELAADLPLINALWRNLSDAWAEGNDRGLAVGWEAAYPGLPDITQERCRAATFPYGLMEGYTEEWVLDEATVERDDGWLYPPAPDFALEGRIYVMSTTFTNSAPGYESEPSSTREAHVAVKDGKAHYFPKCDQP